MRQIFAPAHRPDIWRQRMRQSRTVGQIAIINHSRWIGYNFRLSPKKAITALSWLRCITNFHCCSPIMATFDNLSAITPIVCGPEPMPSWHQETFRPVAAKGLPKRPGTYSQNGYLQQQNKCKTESKPESIGNSSRKVWYIVWKKCISTPTNNDIKPKRSPTRKLVQFLLKRPDVTIEVGGHTKITRCGQTTPSPSNFLPTAPKLSPNGSSQEVFPPVRFNTKAMAGQNQSCPIPRQKEGLEISG